MTAIAELEENRTVEGIDAVARKERLRTRNGSSYLALELVDASGRIPARVWNDVEMLDGRFETGDAVRVLGRVERFRNELQVEARTEPAQDVDPAGLTPGLRRDADQLQGFLEFLVGEVHEDTCAASSPGRSRTRRCARIRRPRTATTRTQAACSIHGRRGDALPRTQPDPSAAAPRPAGRRGARPRRRPDAELGRPPVFAPTEEGRLLGHVHLGLRTLEALDAPAELLHAVACHHDARAARTAEAAVLDHANQLDAVAATRPAPD